MCYVFWDDAVGGYSEYGIRACVLIGRPAIAICLGIDGVGVVKSHPHSLLPVSEGVSGGHLNRICGRIA